MLHNFRLELLFFIAILIESKTLSIIEVIIPKAVKTMDTITLYCKYDLEGDPLYTVKWYQGMHEFFRYIPKEHPNMVTFPTNQELDVDLTKSTSNQVVLRNMKPEMSGKYMCEVSTDAPNFYTKKQQSYMYIVDVPTSDPIMIVDKGPLQIGYTINANCSSPPSYPPANVTWYLNDQKIPTSLKAYSEQKSSKPVTADKRRVPKITTAHLELEINETTFIRGKARLKCLVNIFDLYKKEKEEILYEDNPHPRPSSVFGVPDSAKDLTLRGKDFTLLTVIFFSILSILR